MKQNKNLGESSKNFLFLCSQCPQKFKTYHGTLQYMWFCKENYKVDQGEGTESDKKHRTQQRNEISRRDRQSI